MLNKFDKKDDFFLNGKFKKFYFIITISICLLWLAIALVLRLFKVDLINNDIFYIYYNAFIIVFLIAGMIIDEKIRKYPGLIVLIGTSIYCFVYVSLCSIGGTYVNVIVSFIFLLNVLLSYILYKRVYPLIVISKNKVKIFNTFYLIIMLTLSIIVGMLNIL